MTIVDVDKIAEAVLYEGYLLFPYRRSAMKNQQRWTFGGVYPRGFSEEGGGSDPWHMQTQCLVRGGQDAALDVRVRCLQVVDRAVAQAGLSGYAPVASLAVGGTVYRPWEEAAEREFTSGDGFVRLADIAERPVIIRADLPAGSAIEPLLDGEGTEVGALVRSWRALQGRIEVSAERLDDLWRVTVRISNEAPWPPDGATEPPARADALRSTFVSTHTILRVCGGEFVSLLEPPEDCRDAAAACENLKTWPVLVGEPGERHTLLSSPIILYDYPQVSPESQGNYFDATEIDELLALSVMTLTDEEKREMRESDDRGRAVLERTESLSEEQLLKMHGVVRYLRPTPSPHNPLSPDTGARVARTSPGKGEQPEFAPFPLREGIGGWMSPLDAPCGEPEDPFPSREGVGGRSPDHDIPFWETEGSAPTSLEVQGVEISAGSRVRLHPKAGGDIIDMALTGRLAIVESFERDLEDNVHVAVVVEDDPGMDLGYARQPGHRFFFSADEIEPVGADW